MVRGGKSRNIAVVDRSWDTGTRHVGARGHDQLSIWSLVGPGAWGPEYGNFDWNGSKVDVDPSLPVQRQFALCGSTQAGVRTMDEPSMHT
ncbi:hypothetical protein WG66_008667 [Moniliophthora roreri]|nr:hypothetical protein WG66_008667 [Moniliophthora roreri]